MNIPKLLAVNARKFPAGEALITADCRLSWSELHDQSLRLAAYLHEQYQISAGDRVALRKYLPGHGAGVQPVTSWRTLLSRCPRQGVDGTQN